MQKKIARRMLISNIEALYQEYDIKESAMTWFEITADNKIIFHSPKPSRRAQQTLLNQQTPLPYRLQSRNRLFRVFSIKYTTPRHQNICSRLQDSLCILQAYAAVYFDFCTEIFRVQFF